MVRVRVLGPIEAEVNGARVDLGGPRQKAVLALLLSVRGSVVPADRMIDRLWRGEPPPRAIASLQSYVSNLRRLIEPDRPPRAPARVLVSSPPGYALRLPEDAVDAWRFEDAFRQARTAPADRARQLLNDALGWWRGPAYSEVTDEEWALVEVARLTELRLSAREFAIDATIRAGHCTDAVPLAEVFTREHPLREEGWRLLALALWASGRQADALGALRRKRRILQDELGLDPGPALIELERAILVQRMDVLYTAVPQVGGNDSAGSIHGTAENAPPGRTPAKDSPTEGPPSEGEPVAAVIPAEARPVDVFVGRKTELRALAQVAETARHSGGAVLVTGEAGAGKSRLLTEAARRLEADGWVVVAGRCPEFDGAPAAWAWSEALRSLARRLPPTDPDAVAPLLRESSSLAPPGTADDSATGRFMLHRAVGGWMRKAAATAPLAVVVDDLHRADAETLALLEHLTGPDGAPVLVFTAYRPADAGGLLAATLAELASRSPYRLALAGLPLSDVRTLVSAVCGAPVDGDTLAALADRTGGNPFYVRESAQLLADEGSLVAVSEVPQGVRDVLRRRLARLPEHVVAVLRLAAVVGREADIDVLLHAADLDGLPEDDVLDGLESGVLAGLLDEPAPGRVRFGHALVRDTLYTDLTRLRRSRAHARVAEALRVLRPGDPTALAHHCSQAGTAALAPLAVDYALRAAKLAERRYAHDAEVALLERAVEAFERIAEPVGDQQARLVDLLGRLLRAQIRAGVATAARVTRQRAIDVAERAGRDDLLAAALTGWQVPTPWQTRPYGVVDRVVVDAIERLLTDGELAPRTRCRLLDTLVAELTGEQDSGRRVVLAARELLAIARRTGDPALLAMALTSSAKCRSYERAVGMRQRIAAELREVTRRHDVPVYHWVCEFIDGSVAGARNDPVALRRHAEAGLAIARRYRMVEPEVVHMAALAMLTHIQGDFEAAEARYAEVSARMLHCGMMHARDFQELALLTIRLSEHRNAEAEALARTRYERMGPIAGDTLALALARQGRPDEARALGRTPLRADHHHTRHATIRAELALLLGRREEAPELIRLLLPLRDQLSGAAYTAYAMQPVAHSLGELYRLLGDETAAASHFAHAETIAGRWSSPHWAAAARSARGAPQPAAPRA
ncbi:BTAD domain-containing putative transcriptional regulator [Streptomyces canus]|uniref:BTAD domain-containing putative transcriptional regulator n=1 Tax=Streptomyces canus TaxID=58343 RepID=UPI003814C312